METSISNEIIKVLDALCDKFGIAVDWSSENVLPYLNTLVDKCVNYEITTSIYWIFIAVIVGGFGLYFFFHGKYIGKKTNWDEGFGTSLTGLICLCACLVIIPSQMHDLIQCFTFPELTFLNQIQQITNLIK